MEAGKQRASDERRRRKQRRASHGTREPLGPDCPQTRRGLKEKKKNSTLNIIFCGDRGGTLRWSAEGFAHLKKNQTVGLVSEAEIEGTRRGFRKSKESPRSISRNGSRCWDRQSAARTSPAAGESVGGDRERPDGKF